MEIKDYNRMLTSYLLTHYRFTSMDDDDSD